MISHTARNTATGSIPHLALIFPTSHAFKESCTFLGRSPHALLHDNKPIYSDKKLHDAVEKTTRMIPATLRRPENKAILEGAFGKFEQEVGRIYLDDSSEEALKKSAVAEILRAYTAGSDHAGRVEFDGKSRRSCAMPARILTGSKDLLSDCMLITANRNARIASQPGK